MILDSYRLRSYLAPSIEEKLITNDISDDVIAFFYNAWDIFDKLKHVSLFILPYGLKFVFDYPKLRLIKELIETSSQSRIIFVKYDIDLPCTSDTAILNKIMPSHVYSLCAKESLVRSLHSNKYPILLDVNCYPVTKQKCVKCDLIDFTCSDEVLLSVANLPELKKLETLSDIIKSNISYWHIDVDNIRSDDIKALAYLVGLLYNLDEPALESINKFEIHDGFINDLKKNTSHEYTNIAFSMLRAIAYPPTSDLARHQYSIDCHRNDPYKHNGHNLFRVDVMPPTKSGVSSSGVERLLLAQNGDKFIYVCYTNDHDFVLKTIKDRLK